LDTPSYIDSSLSQLTDILFDKFLYESINEQSINQSINQWFSQLESNSPLQFVHEHADQAAIRIRRFKSLWLQLSELTQELGSAQGCSYICSLLMFFVQEVLAVYGFLSEMESGFDVVNSTFAVIAIIFSYGIFVICDGGQLATEQVGTQQGGRYA
jgi:hypothetical protein